MAKKTKETPEVETPEVETPEVETPKALIRKAIELLEKSNNVRKTILIRDLKVVLSEL